MNRDLFVYDTERFNSLASEDILQQGLDYSTKHHVLTLDVQNNVLKAHVTDAGTTQPYTVELTQHTRNKLTSECECPHSGTVCKHAIAALYSYLAHTERQKKYLDHAKNEIFREYNRQSQSEIRVKLISGNLGFGIWQSTSTIPEAHGTQAHQVHIRSLDQPLNYCTCPDIYRHRLGTCQHIEAVLHYAKSKRDYEAYRAAVPPISFAYLAWQDNKPTIRIQPTATISNELVAISADFFTPNKLFSGHLPGDFFRFAKRVSNREDFQIGEDVLRYVQQCTDNETKALRAEKISQDIMGTNGVLSGIKVRLFPYQTEGVAFLASRGRALLADDMGLGKTLQAISASLWLASHDNVKKVLIVCPSSLKYQWAREINKFTPLKAQIIRGNTEQRKLQYQTDTLFFIINYELALHDIDVISEYFKPDLLILDELQHIKNWCTRFVPKLKLITSPSVFVLSSVVLDKQLNDLRGLIQLVDDDLLDPLWRYPLDYHITDEHNNIIGYSHLEELYKCIAPVILRRHRNDVSSQLLEKTEVRLDIPLDKKQRELHDAAMSDATELAQLTTHRALTPGEQHRFMAALQRARIVCNAAGLIDHDKQDSPKLQELQHLLTELCLKGQHKAVIFSQWISMTEMTESLVKQMGLTCVLLHGGLSNDKRAELISDFQKNNTAQILISTDAGAAGLTLKAVTVLINLDIPWNPAILDHRVARLYKSGQKHNLQIFSMLAEDSYEQQVTKLVKSKRDIFDNIISPETVDDVVGVSKKMLQTLIDGVLIKIIATDKYPDAKSVPFKHIKTSATAIQSENNLKIQQLIDKIKIIFHYRIQRILGSELGLLIVVAPLNTTDEDTAQQLSTTDIPVAIIDNKTLISLKRLKNFSELNKIPVLYKPNIQSTVNPLTQLAQAKLKSATILIAQKCGAGVLDLLASAMLLQAAAIVGQFQAPTIDNVAVWLYNEILPQQLLTQEQAATIMRVVLLCQCQDVPFSLIEQAVADAKLLCQPTTYYNLSTKSSTQ